MQVYSEFSLDASETTTVDFERCRFFSPYVDYLGRAIFNAQSKIVIEDTELITDDDTNIAATNMSNLVYVAGGEAVSRSACPVGKYGSCVAIGEGAAYSCGHPPEPFR